MVSLIFVFCFPFFIIAGLLFSCTVPEPVTHLCTPYCISIHNLVNAACVCVRGVRVWCAPAAAPHAGAPLVLSLKTISFAKKGLPYNYRTREIAFEHPFEPLRITYITPPPLLPLLTFSQSQRVAVAATHTLRAMVTSSCHRLCPGLPATRTDLDEEAFLWPNSIYRPPVAG